MSVPSSSLSTEGIICATLVKYEDLTKKDLVNNPLAAEIKSAASTTTSICSVFEKHTGKFQVQADDRVRLMGCLNVIVDSLRDLSTTPALSEVPGLQATSPPVQLVFSAINILLAMAKSDATHCDCDPLVDIFHYAGIVLERLKTHLKVRLSDASVKPMAIPEASQVTQVLVKIMCDLVVAFALATKLVEDRQLIRNYAKKLRGPNDVDKILSRLDRLTPEHAQRTVRPALEVIYYLVHNMTRVMGGENAWTEDINKGLFAIQEEVTKNIGGERHKLQMLRSWLKAPNPSINHDIARKAYHDGTTAWVIEDKNFQQWNTTGGQLLWIYGDPGSGKTILCSTIINHARSMRRAGLAAVGYFYVDFNDHTKQDARGLLSSLLDQLSTQSNPYFDILSGFHARHNQGGERPSETALSKCLKEMLEYPEQAPVFIVVDALDECPGSSSRSSRSRTVVPTPRQLVLKVLKGLIELKLENLHLCVTSRHEVDIQDELNSFKSEPLPVSLYDQRGQLDDIAQYVESVVASDVTMRGWPKRIQRSVVNTLTNESHGMFRWASCQLEYLRHCPWPDVPDALGKLPPTLNETYEHMLKNIHEHKQKYARYIFQFLTVSARPLSVRELAEVYAIYGDDSAGTLKFDHLRREKNAEVAVRTACPSLISIDDIDGEKRVRFSHFSVREFLTSARLADSESLDDSTLSRYYVHRQRAHTFSAKLCLGVLLALNDHISKDNVNVMFPLASYAAENWVKHANDGDPSSIVQLEDEMSRLLDRKKPQFKVWIWVYDIDNPSGPHLVDNHPRKPKTSPLYYAALCGFLNMVERLTKSHPGDVNAPGRDGGTPLHASLRNGHSDVALALLEKDADVRIQDNRGETPLHIASGRGDIKAMKSLFVHEAKPDVKNKEDETPLSLASSNGNLEAVQDLVGRFPPLVKKQVARKRTVLHVAAIHGHTSISRFLLTKGADIHAKDENGRTPLHLAASLGRDDIANLFLQNQANVNAKDESNMTPLHLASSGGHVEVVEVLLEHKVRVRVNAKEEGGWTALHLAVYNGYFHVVESLIGRGAILDIKNNENKTPRDLASESPHFAAFEKLGLGRAGRSH